MAVVPRPRVPHLALSTLLHCHPPPQPVVRAAHLLSPQLGHEDAKNADKDEEINLLGETETEPARSRAGNQRVEPRFRPGGGGAGRTNMVRRIGVRMIHQMALTSFRSQHLEEGF